MIDYTTTLLATLLVMFAVVNPVAGAVLDFLRRREAAYIVQLKADYDRKMWEASSCEEELRVSKKMNESLMAFIAAHPDLRVQAGGDLVMGNKTMQDSIGADKIGRDSIQ